MFVFKLIKKIIELIISPKKILLLEVTLTHVSMVEIQPLLLRMNTIFTILIILKTFLNNGIGPLESFTGHSTQ